jgi:tetratricopeptide (TPR) repeat protein
VVGLSEITDRESEKAFDEGLRLYVEGKIRESLPFFQQALRLKGGTDDEMELHFLGANLSNLGRYAEALTHLKRAAEMNGSMQNCHWLGTTYCS